MGGKPDYFIGSVGDGFVGDGVFADDGIKSLKVWLDFQFHNYLLSATSDGLEWLLQPPRTGCIHLFPTLLSVTSSQLLEICHSGSIYTMETGNQYESEFFPQPWRAGC